MRTLRKHLATALATAAIVLLISCAGENAGERHAANLKDAGSRNQAPEFELKDADGNVLRLSDLKGKVVLLNFWATWCGPCKIEIPWFVEMERELKDEGFAVVGVSMDEDGWDIVKPFMADFKVNYRMVLGTEEVGQLYGGVQSLPQTFLIDRAGRIARMHSGLVGKDVFEGEVRALLNDKASAAAGNAGRATAGRAR